MGWLGLEGEGNRGGREEGRGMCILRCEGIGMALGI